MSKAWIKTSDRLPAEGTVVEWIPPSGGEPIVGKKGPGRLWFIDGVYVYYDPSPFYWREAKE